MPDELLAALEPRQAIGETPVLQAEISGSFICLSTYRNMWQSLTRSLCVAEKDIEQEDGASILAAHYYRHNYASMLYEAGVDVLLAKKWLGHADVKTTLAIYTHLDKAKEKTDAQLIKDVFKTKLPKSCQNEKNVNRPNEKTP